MRLNEMEGVTAFVDDLCALIREMFKNGKRGS
jgi:hypothetical protein